MIKTPLTQAQMTSSPTWPTVLAFAMRMEMKLAQDRHKGNREGWLKEHPDDLLNRLGEEVAELWSEVGEALAAGMPTPESLDRVINEAADVANFAMMLADGSAEALGLKNPLSFPATWQERVLAESGELGIRLDKLTEFLNKERPEGEELDPEDRQLLQRQQEAMAAYLLALEARIKRF